MLDGSDLSTSLIRGQSNFTIFVLSNAKAGDEKNYVEWYKGEFRSKVRDIARVTRVRLYEADSVDITFERFPILPTKYLTLVSVAVDSAEDSETIIDQLYKLHEAASSTDVTIWLYYPASEKYGVDLGAVPSNLTVHYTNPVVGREAEFYEHFCTRLIRRAALFKPLVSGQRFERSLFQKTGALEPLYQTIGLYEQAGSAEDLIESFKNPPPGIPNIDALDVERFTETAYRTLD